MALKGYRTYKNHYVDNGEKFSTNITGTTFIPEFKNVNTIQVWDVLNPSGNIVVNRWVADTLTDRSLHEITIHNATSEVTKIEFASSYVLEDETDDFDPAKSANVTDVILIPPGKRAYFYATGINSTLEETSNNIRLSMRTGSKSEV